MGSEEKFGCVIKDTSVPSEIFLIDAVLTFKPMYLAAPVKHLFSSSLAQNQHKQCRACFTTCIALW